MRRTFILWLAVYTLFAQPHLPACWLMNHPCEVHPHPDHNENLPHSHEYLLDLLDGVPADARPETLGASALLLALLGTSSLRNLFPELISWKHSRVISPESPPPRT